MSEVGALIIHLQAETAQFRADIGKAKKDIQDLKNEDSGTAFKKMGEGAGGLRTQIGLLDNAIRGAHSQAMADLIRRFSDSAIVMNALPMAATAAALVVVGEMVVSLAEKLKKLKSGTDDLTLSQNTFEGTVASVYTRWQDKLLEVGIKADDLRGDHLAALQKQLELIDHQSLADLESSFDELAKAADAAFVQLKSHWYEFSDDGSKRAQKALTDFQSQYELLLKTGNSGGANDLLQGEYAKWQKIVAAQNESVALFKEAYKNGEGVGLSAEKQAQYTADINYLQQQGIGNQAKEVKSAQDYLEILQAQVDAQKTIATTAHVEAHTDRTEALQKQTEEWTKQSNDLQKISDDTTKAFYEQLDALSRVDEQEIKSGASVVKTMAEQAKAVEEAQKQETDAVIRSAQQQADAMKSQLSAMESHKRDLTENMAAGPMRAIVNNQQDTAMLSTLAADIARVKQNLLSLNEEYDKYADSVAALTPEQEQQANQLKSAIDTQKNDLTSLQEKYDSVFADMQKNTVTLGMIWQTSAQQMENAFNNSFVQFIDHGGSAFKMVTSMGEAFVSNFIKQSLEATETYIASKLRQGAADHAAAGQHVAANSMTAASDKQTGIMSQLSAAKAGAAKAYQAMAGIPIVGPELGAIAAAGAFAFMMSFEVGGKIPGSGPVPIMGHGGETVVTKALTDRVERAEGQGSKGSGAQFHYHDNSTHQALDSTGMEAVLANHRDTIMREVRSQMRRSNR